MLLLLSTNPYHHTHFATPLPHTLCSKALTFEVYNSCSGTVIFPPHRFTLTFKILSLNPNIQNTTLEASFFCFVFFLATTLNFKKIFNHIVTPMFNHIFYCRLVERKNTCKTICKNQYLVQN